MGRTRDGGSRRSSSGVVVSASAVFGEGESVSLARGLVRGFLRDVQGEHGLPVSERVWDTVQLVVSELVTNARRHAPGACLLTLEVRGGAVEVSVWDGDPTPPTILPHDPDRLGRHGLEIVMALCRSFAVHRETVGKRISACVVLADDPGGHVAGRRP
ncbi:ATP-binding protein [Embleya sp. NPDC005971]|uniref:ATP-binding protein n=1 Tax=Embleya sp. NPDC005971 TaxID=3156724 RepID=UPI0033CD82AE